MRIFKSDHNPKTYPISNDMKLCSLYWDIKEDTLLKIQEWKAEHPDKFMLVKVSEKPKSKLGKIKLRL